MDKLRALSNDDLLVHLGAAVVRDNITNAELLRLLDEVDRRELWAELAHSSMFDFCVETYRMSDAVAGSRIGVARTARRFPIIFDMIERGEIHLTGVLRLKAHLTDENHRDVLEKAKHKTVAEIERLVSGLAPRTDARSLVRAFPQRPNLTPAQARGPAAKDERAPNPTPTAPNRYRLHVTIDEETHSQLTQLQDLLAHQVPDGDPALIIKRALAALLERTLAKKAALTKRPGKPAKSHGAGQAATPSKAAKPPGSEQTATDAKSAARASKPAESEHAAASSKSSKSARRSRSVPAAVRRAVWKRDDGRCAFLGTGGRRCNATRALEYAHIEPWAKGGEHSVDNVALRCRAHNAYEANRDYGKPFMDAKKTKTAATSKNEASATTATSAKKKTGGVREEVARYVARPGASVRSLHKYRYVCVGRAGATAAAGVEPSGRRPSATACRGS